MSAASGVAYFDNGEIALSWQPPLNDNGAPVSGYVIQSLVDGRITRSANVGSAVGSTTITGLTTGTTYSFTVAAINARGLGHASTSRQVTPK